MFNKRLVQRALAASAFALVVGHAHAATYTLDLHGVVADGATGHFDGGGVHYDQYSVYLTGLDSTNSFTVVEGDVINATVTFDEELTIPASVTRTNFAFFVEGDTFPSVDTGVHGTISIFDGPNLVLSQGSGAGTSGFLANTIDIYPPDNGPITFDSFTSSFTIDTLSDPGTVNRAVFDYTLVGPAAVPEPAAWALMLVGFGGLGAALRLSHRSAAIA